MEGTLERTSISISNDNNSTSVNGLFPSTSKWWLSTIYTFIVCRTAIWILLYMQYQDIKNSTKYNKQRAVKDDQLLLSYITFRVAFSTFSIASCVRALYHKCDAYFVCVLLYSWNESIQADASLSSAKRAAEMVLEERNKKSSSLWGSTIVVIPNCSQFIMWEQQMVLIDR